MMQVRLLATDRAIALACARHVSRDVKPDSPTVTAPRIGPLLHDASPYARGKQHGSWLDASISAHEPVSFIWVFAPSAGLEFSSKKAISVSSEILALQRL